jgi:hypothetical protein
MPPGPIAPGTHFEGPVLGSHQSAGGLFSDCSIAISSARLGYVWVDDFIEAGSTRIAAAGTHWTIVQTGAAGTVTTVAGTHRQRLATTAADNAGPTLTLGGTEFVARIRNDDPGTPTRINVGAVEWLAMPANASGVTAGAFLGMQQGTAAPITTTETINTGAVTSGAGFQFTGDGRPRPVAWTGAALETLTNPPVPSAWVVNTPRRYGIRLETSDSLIDRIFWYLDGTLIFSHQMSSQFDNVLRASAAIISRAAADHQMDVDYCMVGSWERA